MISKQRFCKIIRRLESAENLVEKVNALLRASEDNVDFCNAAAMSINHEGIVVELLDEMLGEGELVSYFIYEMDYGKNYKLGCVTEKDGTEIDIMHLFQKYMVPLKKCRMAIYVPPERKEPDVLCAASVFT